MVAASESERLLEVGTAPSAAARTIRLPTKPAAPLARPLQSGTTYLIESDDGDGRVALLAQLAGTRSTAAASSRRPSAREALV